MSSTDNILELVTGLVEGSSRVAVPIFQELAKKKIDANFDSTPVSDYETLTGTSTGLDKNKRLTPTEVEILQSSHKERMKKEEEMSTRQFELQKVRENQVSDYVTGQQALDFVPSGMKGKYPNIKPTEKYNKALLPLLTKEEGINATFGEKQQQQYDKRWDSFTKQNDPYTAGSRTTIGILGRANLQAKRAKVTLSNPMVTNAEAGNIMADIAGIYQGGAPTDITFKHQAYDTLYGKANQTLQFLTGKPQDVIPKPIKDRLMQTINSMQSVNNDILKTHNDYIEKTQMDLISHKSNEWKAFRSGIEGDTTDINTTSIEDKRSALRKKLQF